MKNTRKRRSTGPQINSVGSGRYCYVRYGVSGQQTVFRFRTQREAQAAMAKGTELDHVVGSPPFLVQAIQRAALLARQKN